MATRRRRPCRSARRWTGVRKAPRLRSKDGSVSLEGRVRRARVRRYNRAVPLRGGPIRVILIGLHPA